MTILKWKKMGILVYIIRKNENKRKGFNFLLHFHSYIFFYYQKNNSVFRFWCAGFEKFIEWELIQGESGLMVFIWIGWENLITCLIILLYKHFKGWK